MTFLSLGIEKCCLTQQKDVLEYQMMCYSSEYNDITAEMAEYEDANEDGSYDNVIASLEAQQEIYDQKKESLETQLEVINAEIESYDKAVTQNIKGECKLSFSV